MIREEYEEIERNPTTIKKKAIYLSEDLGNDKTFDGIREKYKNYRFTEHIQLLRDEFECQSRSHIIFSIKFILKDETPKNFNLISSVLEIYNWDEIEYFTFDMIDAEEDIKQIVNNLLKNNTYNSVIIKAKMETKFFINRSLDIENQYETEELDEIYDEGDDNHPIIETPFITDNCSICLTAKPNIIIIPCLHQSVCDQCEEAGKLIKCPTCRERIERKIKI